MSYKNENDSNIYGRNYEQRVVNMSSRQQVLFLLDKTMKEANWSNETQEEDNYKIVNQNDQFEAMRREQRMKEINEKPMRWILLADSLHQYIPIKSNKYIDRNRQLISEKEAYNCACKLQTGRFNKATHPDISFDCGDRCINRCVSTECFGKTCPAGQF